MLSIHKPGIINLFSKTICLCKQPFVLRQTVKFWLLRVIVWQEVLPNQLVSKLDYLSVGLPVGRSASRSAGQPIITQLRVIPGLRRSLNEIFALLGCYTAYVGRGQLKCDGTRAETRFRLSAKRTSPFKSAGASVQSTTGSRSLRISGSNAGYTTF